MAGISYVLDTNAIAELFDPASSVSRRLRLALNADDRVYICQPVHYEVLRGLLKVKATRRLQTYREQLLSVLDWVALDDADWEQAARVWTDVTSRGRQLSDMDTPIAAISMRLGSIIVSADNDYDALPIPREDWREPMRSEL